jgi:hypothetical protein
VSAINATDSHFIVHLFVTAVASGKLQSGGLSQKTWDVLQQVTVLGLGWLVGLGTRLDGWFGD